MKCRHAIPLLLLAITAHAENNAKPRVVSAESRSAVVSPLSLPGAPSSWLGVDLSKPDPSLISHLPALPPGVGFLVKSVDESGPAARAGLKETDLLWKLNEQLLVNEAQLSTLLRLHQPNDKIALSVFRGGKQLELTVTLGDSPLPTSDAMGRAAEEAVFLSEQGPMRVVNLEAREAYIANSEGRATVRKVEGGYWLTIENAAGEVLFDHSFEPESGKCEASNAISTEWMRRAYALRRGLDHALDGRIMPQRNPRPRVVPPSPSIDP